MNKGQKVIKITSYIIMILLILGAFQMIFDKNYKNDHLGGLFLIAFWLVNSLYAFYSDKKEDNKKSALSNVLLVIVASVILLSYSIKMIFH
ncbi:hypothetical protein GCM10011351_31990 [Paraliobacillus quinghaiensis]|uniref:DUF3953 domain-containing protein n=1 Tax=Paraliobacillus quinghaiensis TaxID=470815 RepID=A0A917WXY9_9BACI|nr:hypothetical protein [Paraliobacillus quinghaiensis]GGM43601.1 hypothetical protein GCM10011351_31990 [Paraliobacillus quinghaiensis]